MCIRDRDNRLSVSLGSLSVGQGVVSGSPGSGRPGSGRPSSAGRPGSAGRQGSGKRWGSGGLTSLLGELADAADGPQQLDLQLDQSLAQHVESDLFAQAMSPRVGAETDDPTGGRLWRSRDTSSDRARSWHLPALPDASGGWSFM